MNGMPKTFLREKMVSKKIAPSFFALTLLLLSLLSAAEVSAQEGGPVTPVAPTGGVVTPGSYDSTVISGETNTSGGSTGSNVGGAALEDAAVENIATELAETPTSVTEKEVVVVQPVAAVAAPAAPAPVAEKISDKAAESPAQTEGEKKWYDYVSLSPSLVLWMPIDFGNLARSKPEVFFASLKIRAAYGPFELILEPSFRQTKNRRFFPSNVVLKQAYLKWDTPVEGLSLSGGLLYNQFGFFWDGSFFGNNTAYVGRKLNADYNLQAEWTKKFNDNCELQAWFQLSPGTDGTNITLFEWLSPPVDTARDFESDPYYSPGVAARLRVVPKFSFGALYFMPGLSLEYARVTRFKQLPAPPGKPVPPPPPGAKLEVDGIGGSLSAAADLSIGWKKLRWTSEFVAQTIDASLSPKNHRVNRYHISSSVFAPVYFNPKADWFKVFIATAGFSYSLYQTEKFNEMLYEIGLLTQVYEHVKTRIEYGRYWTPNSPANAPKSYAHQLEFLLYVDF